MQQSGTVTLMEGSCIGTTGNGFLHVSVSDEERKEICIESPVSKSPCDSECRATFSVDSLCEELGCRTERHKIVRISDTKGRSGGSSPKELNASRVSYDKSGGAITVRLDAESDPVFWCEFTMHFEILFA